MMMMMMICAYEQEEHMNKWYMNIYVPMNKWYMHNPESVLENEKHKILWDFEKQTEDLMSPR